MFRAALKLLVSAAIALAVPALASAQEYPSRPLTMVIPFAAGGPTDVLGRIVAQRLGEVLGQQVVVENVGGAGGGNGSLRVANAPADGYTMVLGTVGTHAQNQTLYKRPLYNAEGDFTPVALLADVPIVLVIRKDLPVKDFKDFVAYTKANAGKMTFASAGAGSASHLACVVFNSAAGLPVTHVPYRGTGPAMQDLQGGRVDYLCDMISTAKPQIDGGAVKPIAILTKDRSPALPNLSSATEEGTKVEAYTWNAIFLPKNAPKAIVDKLNAALVDTMKTPWVQERLAALGAVVVSPDRMTPEYLAKFVNSEIEKWAAPIKASGVQVE
ncbi:tripartite tricarboxylate transporter substrate-binding protein [Rhodoplanes sp. TEM]|uniref:Tripartite tricarboxylate transporter substrate-binding protein n=1 Tax=Rhodoplanes tepidamans TaxID=200616 RepID=A0ABT5J8B7_RHOTP|nr:MULTISPECIES: tripartite tricarboxylate transporter substrate-binding protein [Rhodoplanes]MDC7785748.1 tripartite tricarboxylate transporter substrate-binding protein [Rhodoplanes tepidamans]MDC7986286.1 tripartite tricarboxylate transporter substrate-binding protein [Rhodoplanes sp. TEM]MDQ0354690.1 tripartite-type tricarboxylate transporter receptor subunit TctC [Rhodoplanes tepidamans]